MKDFTYITIIAGLVLFLFIVVGNINIIPIFEWMTRFVLPWIALYWFIRFVRMKEKLIGKGDKIHAEG